MSTISVLDGSGNPQTIAAVDTTGQALAADSLPVVLPAAQITTLTPPAAITGFATQTTLAAVLSALGTPAQAGGSVTVSGAVAVTGTFYQATQPVSIASVPSHAVTNAGTFATQATQAGAWNITNVSGTISLPTGAATDALQGALTETAPASDTASSGLNGRLQRIAQRLTSLIALLPTSLGIKTAAASLSVAPASDAVFMIAPAVAANPTNISGTITTGGTAQNAASSNASRKGFMLQNNSGGDLWFSTLATAVASQPSIKLPPGAYYESPLGAGGTGAISIIGATTAQAWSGREW